MIWDGASWRPQRQPNQLVALQGSAVKIVYVQNRAEHESIKGISTKSWRIAHIQSCIFDLGLQNENNSDSYPHSLRGRVGLGNAWMSLAQTWYSRSLPTTMRPRTFTLANAGFDYSSPPCHLPAFMIVCTSPDLSIKR